MGRTNREGKSQNPALFYAPLKTIPLEHIGNLIYVFHSNDTNNILFPPELELLVILYQNNQPDCEIATLLQFHYLVLMNTKLVT